MTFKIIVVAVLAGIVVLIWTSQQRRRSIYRPLAGPAPKAPALGTEAIDHAAFQLDVLRNEEISARAQSRL